MPLDYHNSSPDKDDALDKLIRLSTAGAEPAARPSDDTILAYLTGKATGLQKREVQRALLRSAAFRSDFLELTREMEVLTSPEAQVRFDSADVPAIPADIKRLLGQKNPLIQRWLVEFRAFLNSLQERAALLLSGRLLVLSGAVAVLLAASVMSYRMFTSAPSWVMVQAGVEHNLLVSNSTRGHADLAQSQTYESAKEAALAALNYVVELNDTGACYIVPGLDTLLQSGQVPELLLVVNRLDSSVDSIFGVISSARGNRPEDIRAWAFSLATRNLYQISMKHNHCSTSWEPEFGPEAPVVFTYRADNRYRFVLTLGAHP